jgi:hypothetical protein
LSSLARRSKHAVLAEYGARPIDYRTEDLVELIQALHRGPAPALDAARANALLESGEVVGNIVLVASQSPPPVGSIF